MLLIQYRQTKSNGSEQQHQSTSKINHQHNRNKLKKLKYNLYYCRNEGIRKKTLK